MQEQVQVFNVQCDVGNSKALADLFTWLSRPNMPFDERSVVVDDLVKQFQGLGGPLHLAQQAQHALRRALCGGG